MPTPGAAERPGANPPALATLAASVEQRSTSPGGSTTRLSTRRRSLQICAKLRPGALSSRPTRSWSHSSSSALSCAAPTARRPRRIRDPHFVMGRAARGARAIRIPSGPNRGRRLSPAVAGTGRGRERRGPGDGPGSRLSAGSRSTLRWVSRQSREPSHSWEPSPLGLRRHRAGPQHEVSPPRQLVQGTGPLKNANAGHLPSPQTPRAAHLRRR